MNIKPKISITGIVKTIFRLLRGKQHDFDLDNPVPDVYNYKMWGWKCKRCNLTLWLTRNEINKLPKKLKYGCKGD